MKKLGKILSAMLVTAVVAAGSMIPATAADYPVANQATGSTTEFTKYFVVEEGVDFPSVEFTYTIGQGAAVTPAAGKMEVYEGPDYDQVVVGSADFTTQPVDSNDATNEVFRTVQTGDELLNSTSAVNAGFTAGEDKYAKKTVEIDFSAITFPEPGVYRYTLQEDACSNSGVLCDRTVYSVDVYVIDTNGSLSVESYVIHAGTDAPDSSYGTTATDVNAAKVDGIINRYPTTGLIFAKQVAGNQGSRDKYFKFSVEINGLPANTVLNVDLTNADATSGTNSATYSNYQGQTNETQLTADGSGTVTADFYLQNGQYIAIYGLTPGSTYEVTEDAEDYDSEDAATTNITIGSVTFDDATSGTVANDDIYTGFTNTRNGIIPTGILMKVGPIAIVGLAVVGGIVFLMIRSNKRKAMEAAEEDEEA